MNFETRFDEKPVKINTRIGKCLKNFVFLAGCIGVIGTSASAYHATQVSADVKNDGRGGYLAAVVASNDRYGHVDADKSYFIATLHNKADGMSVSSGRKYFGASKTAYQASPSAAWVYDNCVAYMEQ